MGEKPDLAISKPIQTDDATELNGYDNDQFIWKFKYLLTQNSFYIIGLCLNGPLLLFLTVIESKKSYIKSEDKFVFESLAQE